MKRLFCIFLCVFIFNPLLLTACWDYRETNQITIVAGVAIDKTEEGKYLLSIEVADLHEAGKEGKIKSTVIESEGESIFDAARNAISINYPKLYWAHATTVILSQQVAQEGVVNILDFLCRDAEARLSNNLFVSTGETAREIFDAENPTATIKSAEISNIMEDQKNLSKGLRIQIYEFIKAMGAEGVSGIMTSICTTQKNDKKIIEVCGTAVFKEDKLLGFINQEETKSLSFILDEVKGGVHVVNTGSGSQHGHIVLEILKSKTKIKPACIGNEIKVQIDIEVSTAIDEENAKENYFNEEGLKKLKKMAEEQLKTEIEALIKKVQKDFNSDIFGFGNAVYRELPDVWRRQGKEWYKLYRELEVRVNPTIDIVHSGLLAKPIEVGE